jgi:hypothetical protein
MRTLKALLATSFFVVLGIGCSSTANRESMLSAAGFKMVRADTPEKAAHLKSLPVGKITPVQCNGTIYYTFPDPKQNTLYVGREAQYQDYQRLRRQKQMAKEQLEAAQMKQGNVWGFREPWDEPGWP